MSQDDKEAHLTAEDAEVEKIEDYTTPRVRGFVSVFYFILD